MSVFRLTRHTYETLTQSGSIRDSDENAGHENNRVVAEFDYRQNLHMECGVVAMDPPPPYAIAMKELTQRRMGRVDTQREERGRAANDRSGCLPMASPVNPGIRGSPPPYEEREQAGGTTKAEGEGIANSSSSLQYPCQTTTNSALDTVQ